MTGGLGQVGLHVFRLGLLCGPLDECRWIFSCHSLWLRKLATYFQSLVIWKLVSWSWTAAACDGDFSDWVAEPAHNTEQTLVVLGCCRNNKWHAAGHNHQRWLSTKNSHTHNKHCNEEKGKRGRKEARVNDMVTEKRKYQGMGEERIKKQACRWLEFCFCYIW